MAAGAKQKNRLVIPLLILLALVAVIFFVRNPFGESEVYDEGETLDILLADFSAEDMTRMVINKPDADEFELVRKDGDTWRVIVSGKQYKMDNDKLERMLEAIPGTSAIAIASDNAEKHETFELDAAKGIGLRIYTDSTEPAMQVTVGKADSSFQGSYVLLQDDAKVYQIDSNLKSLLGFQPSDYRSKNPYGYEPAMVSSLTIRRPPAIPEEESTVEEGEEPAPVYPEQSQDKLELSLTDGIWQRANGSNANQNSVNDFVDNFAETTITQFVDEPDTDMAARLEGRQADLIIGLSDGNEMKMTVGPLESGEFTIFDEEGRFYKVSEYNLRHYLELEFDALSIAASSEDTGTAEETVDSEEVPATE